jgi:hypothetical protein
MQRIMWALGSLDLAFEEIKEAETVRLSVA